MAKNAVEILLRIRDEASRGLQEFNEEVSRTEQEARDAAGGVKEFSRETDGLNTKLRTATERLDGLGRGMQSIGSRMTLFISTPLAVLGGVGVRSAQQLEVFQQSLTTLVGNAEEARDVFEELYEFDTDTTFAWPSLTKATTLLAAFNFEADELIPTLGRLGDIAAAVNMNIDELAEIYGKARVQGRLFMEDINQLTGRGIPVIQELAKQFGVTEDQVRSLVSEGRVGFADIEQAFISLTSEGGRFFGMMASQTDTSAGRVQALRKEFEQVTDLIGEHLIPHLDRLVEIARGAIEWFVQLDESTQNLFVNLGITLAATGPVMVGIGTLLVQIPKLIAGFQALQGTMWAFLGPAGVVIALGAAFSVLAEHLVTADSALDTHRSAIDEVADAYFAYRGEIVVTTEQERRAAIDRLATTRAELQERLRLLKELAEEQRTSVQGFLDSPIGRFLMPGFIEAKGSAGYGTLEQISRLEGIVTQVGSDIEALLSGVDRLVTPPGQRPPPTPTPSPTGAPGTGGAGAGSADTRDPYQAPIEAMIAAEAGGPGAGMDTGMSPGAIRHRLKKSRERVEAEAQAVFDAYLDLMEDTSRLAAMAEAEVAGPSAGMDTGMSPGAIKVRLQAVKDRSDAEAQAVFDAYVELLQDTDRLEAMADAEVSGPDMSGGLSQEQVAARLKAGKARADREAAAAFDAYLELMQDTERLEAMADAEVSGPDMGSPLSPAAVKVRLQQVKDRADAEAQAVFDAYLELMQDTSRLGAMAAAEVGGPSAGMSTGLSPGNLRSRLGSNLHDRNVTGAAGLTTGGRTDRIRFDDWSLASDFERAAMAAEVLTEKMLLEIAARQESIDEWTKVTADNKWYINFRNALISLAVDSIPALGAAIETWVLTGDWGVTLTSIFQELVGQSEAFQGFIKEVNLALEPLVRIIGAILSPAFNLLATVLTGVVDTIVAVWNFLFGWLGLGVDPSRGPQESPRAPSRSLQHSPDPFVDGEVRFGGVGSGVQLAVATPLMEAAQLQLTAASTLLRAAETFGQYVGVLTDRGLYVNSATPAPAVAGGANLYSRAAIVRG